MSPDAIVQARLDKVQAAVVAEIQSLAKALGREGLDRAAVTGRLSEFLARLVRWAGTQEMSEMVADATRGIRLPAPRRAAT